MLAEAAAEEGVAMYAAAEAIDLPFRAGAFGFVLSAFALSHFTKYDTALFDMLRVLAPGGCMGVASWGPGDDELTRAWQGVAEEYAEHGILVDARQRATPWQDRFSDVGQTRDTLHEAGLREIRLEPREYRFHITREDYLLGKEMAPTGRFLRYTLGEESWGALRARARAVFADSFPETLNDFRDVVLAVGTKPAG
jgi:SAM-dependent methyltransferase